MKDYIYLPDEERDALLYLPFFRRPNSLSPFYELQKQQTALQQDPRRGLAQLHRKGLWDPQLQELTLEGRQCFVPLFAPTARVMIFSGICAKTPREEFYAFKKYIVRYTEQPRPSLSLPLSEQTLVNHLRQIFADRRPTLSANNLSLFEEEFVTLHFLHDLVAKGDPSDVNGIQMHIQQTTANGGLGLPVIGVMDHSPTLATLLQPTNLQRILSTLAQDGLLHLGSDGFRPASALSVLLEKIRSDKEIYLLREETDSEGLSAREVSIFPGERGYFLGRCTFQHRYNTRVIHLEDLEWHTLFRLINEIARPRDYLATLTLEVTRRIAAHVRG